MKDGKKDRQKRMRREREQASSRMQVATSIHEDKQTPCFVFNSHSSRLVKPLSLHSPSFYLFFFATKYFTEFISKLILHLSVSFCYCDAISDSP